MTDPKKLASDYLDAWARKDAERIGAFLHPDVTFVGPVLQTRGRDAVLAAAERMFPMLQRLEVRALFAEGDRALAAYDFVCAEPIGLCRTAELIGFDGDRISSIELFFDARPFEAAMRAGARS